MRYRETPLLRQSRDAQKSSLPLLLGLISLIGIGYALGSPQIAPHLPKLMQRPFVEMHKQIHKGLEGPMRMVGLS